MATATTTGNDPIVNADLVSLSYPDLVETFPLRPIRSPEARAAARVMMRSLLRLDRTPDQADYLTVLGLLIREYDAEHVILPAPTQAGILRSLLEEREATQAQLAAATGVPDSNISAILTGTRGISRANRAKFAEFFQVSPTRFLIN